MLTHAIKLDAVRQHCRHEAAWVRMRHLMAAARNEDIFHVHTESVVDRLSAAFTCGMDAFCAAQNLGNVPPLSTPLTRRHDDA